MSTDTALQHIPSMLDIGSIFLCLTATLAYINKRWFGLPATIGVMAISLIISIIASVASFFGYGKLIEYQTILMQNLNFTDVLLNGVLSMLLFAGALHIKFHDLRHFQIPIAMLAFAGTALSAFLVAVMVYMILPLLGFDIDFIWCLLFGALISPTDPIAVLGILKSAGAPKSLETVISGESLFNDGIGVVLFSLLISVLLKGEIPTASHVAYILLWEAAGGLIYGLILGYLVYYLVKTIDSHHEEVLLTFAGVLGGYSLANHLHISAPLAMVSMGLVIGNVGRKRAMTIKSRQYVDMFWELVDEFLNAVLFVLMGLEVVMVAFSGNLLLASLFAIVIALIARVSTNGLITRHQRDKLGLPIGSWKVLTWGGLRGGISVALVLQLPIGDERDLLLSMTYAIVIFSILVQGLTIGKVAESLKKNPINQEKGLI